MLLTKILIFRYKDGIEIISDRIISEEFVADKYKVKDSDQDLASPLPKIDVNSKMRSKLKYEKCLRKLVQILWMMSIYWGF